MKYHETIKRICRFGELTEIKQLYEKHSDEIDIHADNDIAFQLCCLYGKFKIARWIYSLGNVNIHARNDIAFRLSCGGGYLEIAKWLYSLGGVDINAKQNTFSSAFNRTCDGGYLRVAKWLYSLGQNDSKYNSLSFYVCCSRNRTDIIKWLLRTEYIPLDSHILFDFDYKNDYCLKYCKSYYTPKNNKLSKIWKHCSNIDMFTF